MEGPWEQYATESGPWDQYKAGAAPDSVGSSVGGAAKSLGTGLAEGVIGLAGLPGDLYHMGLRALGDNLTPESRFGSGAIKKGVEGYTGEFYKPQGAIEETLNKVGQFAPAVIGGPEGLAARAMTRAIVPAVASEAAGKATEGTALQPYAEAAGALAGAAGAAAAGQRFNAMVAARRGANAAPSAEDLLRTAKGQFKSAEDMNLVVSPDWATGAAQKMRADLKGFDPEAQAAVFRAADRLESLASTKAPALTQTQRLELEMNGLPVPMAKPLPVAMNEAELVRKQLVNLKQSNEAPVREAARRAIESLQESQLAINPAQTLRGDAGAYTQTMKDAIGNWAAGKRSNTVMGKVALGDLNAATAGSGANEDNALRQAIKQLVRPVNNDIVPKASRLGFNQAEIDAMNTVARGTPIGNTARYLGKLAPTGSVSGVLGAGAGYGVGGPVGAIALPAAGYVAKKIGDLSTKRAVSALDSLVRSRSPLATQVAAQLPPQVVQQLPAKTQRILQTLALAAPPMRPQVGQPVGQTAAQ